MEVALELTLKRMPTVIILLSIPRIIWRSSKSYLRRVMPVQFTGLENVSNLYSTHWKGPNRIAPGESQIWFHGSESNYVPGSSRILTPLDKIQRRADTLCENLPAISVAIDKDSSGTVGIQPMQSFLRWRYMTHRSADGTILPCSSDCGSARMAIWNSVCSNGQ